MLFLPRLPKALSLAGFSAAGPIPRPGHIEAILPFSHNMNMKFEVFLHLNIFHALSYITFNLQQTEMFL